MFDQALIERYKNSARRHFANHKATIVKFNDNLTTIDWKAPDTNAYYVHYVIDGDKLIISGDLGSAIFQQYGNHLTLEKLSHWINQLAYIAEKNQCCGDMDIYRYDHDYAKADRQADLLNFTPLDCGEDADIEKQEAYQNAMDTFNDLLEELDDNFSEWNGYHVTPHAEDILDELSPDLMLDCVRYWGKEYSPRYIAWLIGLEMIAENQRNN